MSEKEVKQFILRMTVNPKEFGQMLAFGVNPPSAHALLPDPQDLEASEYAANEVSSLFEAHALDTPNIYAKCLALYSSLLNAYCVTRYERLD